MKQVAVVPGERFQEFGQPHVRFDDRIPGIAFRQANGFGHIPFFRKHGLVLFTVRGQDVPSHRLHGFANIFMVVRVNFSLGAVQAHPKRGWNVRPLVSLIRGRHFHTASFGIRIAVKEMVTRVLGARRGTGIVVIGRVRRGCQGGRVPFDTGQVVGVRLAQATLSSAQFTEMVTRRPQFEFVLNQLSVIGRTTNGGQ